jgi:hypothetical protein
MSRVKDDMGDPVSFVTSWIDPRAVMIRGAVSPAALATASIAPVVIPGAAEGKMTLVIVCHFAAPRA